MDMPKFQENNKSSFILSPKQHVCSCCGDMYDIGEYQSQSDVVKLMRERVLCFRCSLWTIRAEHPAPCREIIDGKHYVFHPYQLSIQCNSGRVFYILRPDGSVMRSNYVWFQGVVPDIFKDLFPDTARMISKKVYNQLHNNPFKCQSKGCWDRYSCLRYDLSIEQNSGPWNHIPKSYKIGDEQCESFINKNKLL